MPAGVGQKSFDVEPILDILLTDEMRFGDRIYPGWYASSVGRFRPPAVDVQRMRNALRGLPRVDPELYDILFNAETREWTIVKWVEDAIPYGPVGPYNFTQTVRYPFEIYSIDARKRSTASLSDRDWTHIRAQCKTTTGVGGKQKMQEIAFKEQVRKAKITATEADREHDLSSYYGKFFRRVGEETGISDASPEQMAERFGGRKEDWDPDYIYGERD